MNDDPQTPHDGKETPKRKSFTDGIISGGGTPCLMTDRMAKEAKPRFVTFVKTLKLLPEQETQVIEAGEAANGDHSSLMAGLRSVDAMIDKLLTLRPDLSEAVRGYYAGRNPRGSPNHR